jgi:hypothetical protein
VGWEGGGINAEMDIFWRAVSCLGVCVEEAKKGAKRSVGDRRREQLYGTVARERGTVGVASVR